MNDTPSRKPLTDLYDTKNPSQARSVMGGVYIKALSNKDLSKK
jgi:hypothetical protein